jgi:hypothetical protein
MPKNKLIIAAVLFAFVAISFAQVDTAWTRRYSSSGAVSDAPKAMAIDGIGNIYVAGSHNGTLTNWAVRKYNTNGDLQWFDSYASSSSDRAWSVAYAPSGHLYVAGSGYGGISSNRNFITMKYDTTTGARKWIQAYNYGTGGDDVYMVVLDNDENVYVTGVFYGANSVNEYGTIKYDSAGTQLWIATYRSPGAGSYPATYHSSAKAIVVDNAGYVYVTGSSRLQAGVDYDDYLTIKYNAATGDTVWTRRYDPAGTADIANNIKVDALGNVYVTGSSQSNATTIKYDANGNQIWVQQSPGGGYWLELFGQYLYVYGNTSAYGTGTDLLLIKYDTSGVQQWVQTYNGPNMVGTSYSYDASASGQPSMVLDASGNIYVTGRSTFSGATVTTHTDILTLKYNASGVLQWEVRYNYPALDSMHEGICVSLDNTNNVYVAGSGRGAGTYIDWVVMKLTQGAPANYIINATAYGPGIIVPSGAVLLDTTGFADTTFTFTPNAYAHLDSLLVDGINHGSDSTSYRFVDVTANHTIAAHFSYDQYIITASAVGPGIIAPSGAVVVNGGQNATFDMTPNPNCHIDSVVVDGANQGAIPSYTFYTVIAPHTITAYFSDNPTYTITATAYGPGTIVPSGTIIVYEGDDTTFIITPNLDCQTDSVVIDGTNQGVLTSHTFTNVDANHTIDAYFSPTTPVTYTITASATSGGTITPVGDVIVNQGADTTFYIAAGPDAILDSVLVDGVSVGAVPSYTFYAVVDNHTIHAMFTINLPTGWTQKESIPQAPDKKQGKFVKDGGALVGVGSDLYAFYGNKSRYLYRYRLGVWDSISSIPYALKPPPETVKINKKFVGKGAALCYNGDSIIYAIKGNGTREFWAYNTIRNQWTIRGYAPIPKSFKGGTALQYRDGYVYILAGGQKAGAINFFAYHVSGDSWITSLQQARTDPDNKPFKDGSCLQILGNYLYALKGKGKHNHFYKYDLTGGNWIYNENETIPLWHHRVRKKTKVGAGGAMISDGAYIYAIKGAGKTDFWRYTPADTGVWTALDSVPMLGGSRKSTPKTGASLAYANGIIYLIKGNNTPEFWQYVSAEKSNIKNQISNINTSIQTERIMTSGLRIAVNPNPFTNTTTIRYNVPVSGNVSIKLYNSTGSLIQTLNSGYHDRGDYTLNLSNISSGVYFLRYTNESVSQEIKLVVK